MPVYYTTIETSIFLFIFSIFFFSHFNMNIIWILSFLYRISFFINLLFLRILRTIVKWTFPLRTFDVLWFSRKCWMLKENWINFPLPVIIYLWPVLVRVATSVILICIPRFPWILYRHIANAQEVTLEMSSKFCQHTVFSRLCINSLAQILSIVSYRSKKDRIINRF